MSERKVNTSRWRSIVSKIGIIGAGGWGIALAKVLSNNGHNVIVWSALEDEICMLADKHEHVDKLPGVKLPIEVAFTVNLNDAIIGKDMLVLAVPSLYVRDVSILMKSYIEEKQLIVVVSKGIEEKTLMMQTDIVKDVIPQAEVAILSGPSHAEEVGREIPTTVVVGADKKEVAERVQQSFMNEYFRVYISADVLGIELGGSLKNIIALAAGMADGLGYGDNTKAALITRGIREISRLAHAMGAKQETINGLSGIGDLIVTCASVHSRNRKAGFLIGQGYSMKEAVNEVGMVVEGVFSTKAAVILAKKYHIELPIIEQVNQVLFCDKSAREAVCDLMLRERKAENDEMFWP